MVAFYSVFEVGQNLQSILNLAKIVLVFGQFNASTASLQADKVGLDLIRNNRNEANLNGTWSVGREGMSLLNVHILPKQKTPHIHFSAFVP